MKTSFRFSVFAAILLSCINFGCEQKAEKVETANKNKSAMEMDTTRNPGYIYAIETATSQDMQLSIDKAATMARAEIARQAVGMIQNLLIQFAEEAGNDHELKKINGFIEITKEGFSVNISGSRIKRQTTEREGNIWRAYVLAECPISEIEKKLVERIKDDEEMYGIFQASESFRRLE